MTKLKPGKHLTTPPPDYKGDPEKDWRPTRGYSWEQAKPGNFLALRHGAYSPRKVDPLAKEIEEALLGSGPQFLTDPSYAPALWALARSEARIQLLSEYLEEHGLLEEDGRPRAAVDAVYKFERLASEQRARLGLDPLSRVRIERDLAGGARDFNIAQAMAEGRRIREAAEARMAEQEDRDEAGDPGA